MNPRPLAFLISFALLPVFLLAGSQFPIVQAQSTALIFPKQFFWGVSHKSPQALAPFTTTENLLSPSTSNTYFDDFSNYPSGSTPSGWTQYGTSSIAPAVVDFGGTGTTFHRLEFPAYTAQSTSKWFIKDGFTGSNVTASVKVNFQTNSDGAGLVLAWVDSNNFIAILPNPYWDEIVIWEYANGQIRSTFGTGHSAVPIQTDQDYWLKTVTKVSQTGDRQIDVWWSTDGSNYTLKLSATGLANLTGQIGVGTYQFLSDTLFDDFSITIDAPQIKAWTLIYYLAGDTDPEHKLALQDLVSELKHKGEQANYNVAVMFDGETSGDSQYYASNTASSISKGELNTGDPNTLIEFVDWARETLPSQHTALIISGHGNLNGVAFDYSSNEDYLDMTDLKTAFKQITAHHGKIDILYMDACLMATIEDAYQVQGAFDYYVASENEGWVPNSPLYLQSISPDSSPESLALEMAKSYSENLSVPSQRYSHTISVARLSKLPELILQLKALSKWLNLGMNNYAPIIRDEILPQVQYFDSTGVGGINFSADELIDLYDFARLIKDKINDQNVKDSAQLVMSTIGPIPDDPNPESRYIVPGSEFHNSDGNDVYKGKLDHSHGVSIFFPRPGIRRIWYQGNTLDFAAGTDWAKNATTHSMQTMLPMSTTDIIEWGPMLVEYVKLMSPNAPDDPNPPGLIAPLILPTRIFLPLLQNDKSFLAPTATNTPTSVPSTATNTPIPPTVTPIPPTPTFTPIPNTPPVANNQNVTMAQNTAKSLTLTGSDANNDPLTYIVVSNPSHGTLSGTPPNLTYTPSTGFSGADSFTFKANDGKADSTIATVNITVTPSQTLPTVQFSASAYSVNESGGAATITIILSSASGQVVTVNYATSDGTATAGSDYLATSGTLTFNPGETSKTISVPIIDDIVYELNETVNIGLSSPSNTTLGTPASTTLRIDNDDGLPPVSVQANQDWQDTGIPVQAGDQIQVNYLSGTWTIWKGVDRYTDANGQVGRTETCALLPSANIGGLIGRISTGAVQFLGNSGSFSAQNSGTLQLSMNDCAGQFDTNDGSVTIQITITPH
ncbi:MAG: clostripain-related cysteine peptidase [Caldilineaceae bacterium]